MESPPPPPNARLLFETAAGDTEIPLRDGVLSFGADPSCAVRIKGEGVAPHHAIIRFENGAFELLDLMSPGGTRVNGDSVAAKRLRSGDRIAIGNAEFHFIDGPPARPEPSASVPNRAPTSVDGTIPERWVLEVPGRRGTSLVLSLVAHAILFLTLTQVTKVASPRPTFGTSATFEHATVTYVDAKDAPAAATEAPLSAPLPEAPIETPPDPSPTPFKTDDRASRVETPEPAGRLTDLGGGEFGADRTLAAGEGMPGGFGESGDGPGDFGDARPLPGSAKLKRYAGGLRERGLDVVFAIDTTGSMGPVLAEARARVNAVVMVLSALVPRFRLGVVAYRDRGDAYVVKKSTLTANHWEAVKFLDSLEPGGGGDTPEAVLTALRDAIRNYPWAPKGTRILILVGDAPPHPEELGDVESTVRTFAKERGIVHTLACSVISSGPDLRAVRSAFDKIAAAGRGKALDLSRGESLSRALLPFVFGDEYVDDMRGAIEEVGSGLRARVARRLAAEGSPEDIDAELRRDPPRNEFLAALAEAKRPDRLGVYLDVLGDPKAPLASRWAAAAFAVRTVREARATPATLSAFETLAPDLDPARLADAINAARVKALSEGFRLAPSGR